MNKYLDQKLSSKQVKLANFQALWGPQERLEAQTKSGSNKLSLLAFQKAKAQPLGPTIEVRGLGTLAFQAEHSACM